MAIRSVVGAGIDGYIRGEEKTLITHILCAGNSCRVPTYEELLRECGELEEELDREILTLNRNKLRLQKFRSAVQSLVEAELLE